MRTSRSDGREGLAAGQFPSKGSRTGIRSAPAAASGPRDGPVPPGADARGVAPGHEEEVVAEGPREEVDDGVGRDPDVDLCPAEVLAAGAGDDLALGEEELVEPSPSEAQERDRARSHVPRDADADPRLEVGPELPA